MRTLTLVVIFALVAGCTSLYRPVSDWEQRVFDQSTFDVYPDDVRANFAQFSDTQLAWTGTIESWSLDNSVAPPHMVFTVQHHFFSWAIDGTTRQFWLSPKGEGKFETTWPTRPEWNLEDLKKNVLPGDMLVVYGVPKEVLSNRTINFGEAEYVRLIAKDRFRTDRIEYGRPGEPSRVLSVF